MKKIIMCLASTVIFNTAYAQLPNDHFEVVTISGPIVGEPALSSDAARSSWDLACREWKKEAKELNKQNEVLGMNCNTPSCTFQDSGRTECSSSGSYQVKTAGTQSEPTPVVTAAPAAAPVISQPSPVIVTQPQVVYEEPLPPPRIGYVWVRGYWGWGLGHRRVWHRGYWHHHI